MTQRRRGRDRPRLAVGVVAVVAAGLMTRRFPSMLPGLLGKYPGDALWALMVFLGMAFVWPRAPTGGLAGGSLAFCFAIEASQAYHTPWLDGLRATTPGHLVLGSAFGWLDLVAYAAGVGVGTIGDWLKGLRVPASSEAPGDGSREFLQSNQES